MSCSWIVEHRLRNWKRKLRPLGRKRKEPCGRTSLPVSVTTGMFTSVVELCKAHKRIAERRKKL